MISYFDHIFCHAPNNDLDGVLQTFAKAGFYISPNKMRHPAGHYNGFVMMNRTYLEVLSIIDEEEFERDADENDRHFRKQPQPYGVGAISSDPEQIYNGLKSGYPNTKKPYSRGKPESTEMLWTFAEIPSEALPGATFFSLKYHMPKTADEFETENRIDRFSGLYFCSETREKDMAIWDQTLGLIADDYRRAGNKAEVSFQELIWVTPAEYNALFGVEWMRRPFSVGKVAGVQLSSLNLELSIKFLVNAGFELNVVQNGKAHFKPHAKTGWTFVIEEKRR